MHHDFPRDFDDELPTSCGKWLFGVLLVASIIAGLVAAGLYANSVIF